MSTFELAAKGKRCPFFCGAKDCRDNVMDGTCQDTWTFIRGQNPLTGEQVSKWECAFRLGWMFSADAARRANETAADVEKLRNMIFDPEARRKELERARITAPETQKAIEAQ